MYELLACGVKCIHNFLRTFFRKCIIFLSLSIRRFWGKGERWKRKRERGEGEKLPFSSPPPPSPIGRPDTQAIYLSFVRTVIIMVKNL